MPRGLPLGASRFGGPADLPAGVDWPKIDGRPLLLMTQLNFGDLRVDRQVPLVAALPQHGWLCLFLDVDQGAGGECVAVQFGGEPGDLIRHDPDPAADAETWTQCHAARAAEHALCLPDIDAVESPVPAAARLDSRDAYDEVRYAVEGLADCHPVTLLGTPTLLNPDPRDGYPVPGDWMLLLEFDQHCPWLAGVGHPRDSVRGPSFGSADFVTYFVRKSDYHAGRLASGRVGYMLT